MKTAAALALLLLVFGCAQRGGEAPTATPTTVSTAPATPTPTAATPQEVVEDPGARLADVRVERGGDGLRVTTWWAPEKGRVGAVVSSDDGFATATYRSWRVGDPTGARSEDRAPVPAFDDLLQQPTTSLRAGVTAVVAGGDGATLFPFTDTARSLDGGRSWTTYDVAEVAGEIGYTSGAVVLPDGRLLALVDHWSGDRRGKPSEVAHGLWVSAGDDWSSYQPLERAFRPPLERTPDGWSPLVSLQGAGDVVWSTTYDGRLYVSTDGAETFRQVEVR